jgi:polysaccharide export outer membrane protein
VLLATVGVRTCFRAGAIGEPASRLQPLPLSRWTRRCLSAQPAAWAPLPRRGAGPAPPLQPSIRASMRPGVSDRTEDILDISVWKIPSSVESCRCVPTVSLPLVNDIQAAGLTPATLRKQVTDRLSEFIPAPEVSVMVREVHSRKVAVVGAVKTPGRFELKSPMTVLEVIALAQGFTDFATRDRIVVLRQNGTTTTRMPFNYRKIADGAEQENFLVKPGDIVVVP